MSANDNGKRARSDSPGRESEKKPKVEVKVSNVWLLQAHYLPDGGDKEPIVMMSFFSCEENARLYWANLVADMLEHEFADDVKKTCDDGTATIPATIRSSLPQLESFITKCGLADNERVSTLVHRSCLYPEIVDIKLQQYIIPRPEHEYDFDGIVGCLQEFSQEINSYSAQLDDPEQEVSNEDMRTSIVDHMVTLQRIADYQDYLQEIGELEELAYLDAKSALRRARAFLTDLTRSDEQHSKGTTNTTAPRL